MSKFKGPHNKRALRFVVWGEPYGFRVVTHRGKYTKSAKKMYAYYNEVREVIESFGIVLPLKPTKTRRLYVHTRAYYIDGVHCDPGNTNKGVIDVLVYNWKKKRKGNDKYVGGSFDSPLYDADYPRTEIEIRGSYFLKQYPSLVSELDTIDGFDISDL